MKASVVLNSLLVFCCLSSVRISHLDDIIHRMKDPGRSAASNHGRGQFMRTGESPARAASTSTCPLASFTCDQTVGDLDMRWRAVFSSTSFEKIEQAKVLVEEASTLFDYSLNIWSEASTQISSGSGLDADVNIASAAVAAAAASSVAKAASGFAKAASFMTLQAKWMVNDALIAINSAGLVATNAVEEERGSVVGEAGLDRSGDHIILQPSLDKDTERSEEVNTSEDNTIKEGSFVEVLSDKGGFKGVWFPSKVLKVKDGDAYVALEGEGFRHLEWVSLTGEEDKAPRIRLSQSMTFLNHEGTRKSQRDARRDHTWCPRDRVDAFINDGWREGIIKDESEKDEFTVHFPAHGNTLAVRALNLRPSIIWQDGHWVEWSRSGEMDCYPREGDASGKRVELSSHTPEVEITAEARVLKHTGAAGSPDPETSAAHAFSAKEKPFTFGKNNEKGLYVNLSDRNVQHLQDVNTSVTQTENTSGKKCIGKTCPLSKRKVSPSAEADIVRKGKFASSEEKSANDRATNLGHDHNPGKSISGASEPRRSSRKIQPTPRLLEGMQSSFL